MSHYNAIPDTPVRRAFISALSGISVAIYDMVVPKSADVPNQYILLTTQTNSQADTSKCGHNWWHTILLDVVSIQDQGYTDRSVLDNICDQINQIVDTLESIGIPGFAVYNTQVMDTHDMSLETQTKTINRKLMRYQFLLGPKGNNFVGFPYTLPFTLS